MRVTPAEVSQGQLTDEHLAEALRTMRDAGFVQLDGMFDLPYIEKFRDTFNDMLERYIAERGGLTGINKNPSFSTNHIGMPVPYVPPFSDPQIVSNPIAVQIMRKLIGEDFRCNGYNSNTSYPGSNIQGIHRDFPPLFGTEHVVPTPPVFVVVNIPLIDFTEKNGSTEVWPGTHLIVDTDPRDSKQLAQRLEHMASVRTNVPLGSLIVRDMRAWHRGMPNESQDVRTMLALIYSRSFMRQTRAIDLPRATWESWPEATREIFRDNVLVESA